jgi:hypothetical protein
VRSLRPDKALQLPSAGRGFMSLRENLPLRESRGEIRETNQSRRACPELVERGRLKITQDAILGTSEMDYSRFGQPTQDHVP